MFIANCKELDFELHNLNDYYIYKVANNRSQVHNRVSTLLTNLDIGTLDPEAKNFITSIIEDFHDIFHLPGDKLTVNNFYSQHIIVNDNTPIYIKNYRRAEA